MRTSHGSRPLGDWYRRRSLSRTFPFDLKRGFSGTFDFGRAAAEAWDADVIRAGNSNTATLFSLKRRSKRQADFKTGSSAGARATG